MQLRYDLYAFIHKALRRELAVLVADLGTLDPGCPTAVADYVERLRACVQLLFAHNQHEDEHLGPHLQRLSPALFAEMESAHHELDAELTALDAAAAELPRSRTHAMYLQLTQFVARYWLHLHREETEYNAVFQAAYTDAELAQIESALVASVEPVKLGRFMQMMALAINPEDGRELAGRAP